jgi:hypothetical protein
LKKGLHALVVMDLKILLRLVDIEREKNKSNWQRLEEKAILVMRLIK